MIREDPAPFYERLKGKFLWSTHLSNMALAINPDGSRFVIDCNITDENNKLTRCSSAKIYQIVSNTEPVLLKKDSMALTKKILGVEFLGEKKVFAPKTKHAHIAD